MFFVKCFFYRQSHFFQSIKINFIVGCSVQTFVNTNTDILILNISLKYYLTLFDVSFLQTEFIDLLIFLIVLNIIDEFIYLH